MAVKSGTWGPLAYGAAFTVGVPLVLVWWATATVGQVPLPTVPFPWSGWILVGVGVGLTAAGMSALRIHGHGWPMNAYPPPIYVASGIYRVLSHPIYVGFALACAGVAVAAASPSGLWLVTPVATIGCVALVLGYERPDLERRFGTDRMHRPLLSLPPARPDRPTAWDRASVYVLVFLPWLVAFEAVYLLGVPPDAVEAYFPFERRWPVWEWTESVYGSVYLFVGLAPLVARTQASVRRLAVTGLLATGIVSLIYLTVPVVAPPRPFEPQSVLGRALVLERASSNTVAAFPAFHVIWSLIAAQAWASRSTRWARVAWTWATVIALSCITTGMHAIADIAAAAAVVVVLSRYDAIWRLLREGAERVANSWREWRWGRVRLINHAFWAAGAGAVGFFTAASLAGPVAFWPLLCVHLVGLLSAGLWAQRLEGSAKLSRPFGYYGSVLGGVVGSVVLGAFAGNTMLLLAAIAAEAPWMQGIGRLRCLVQGCCHGRQAPPGIGIRYTQPRSRVCHIADMRGTPLHPTPLYSIIANVVTGVVLLRLWSLGASLSLIAGIYLILAGAARFVEESYRGEPQTPVVAGLRLYQWLAVLSFVAGIVLTAIPTAGAPGLPGSLALRIPLAAVAFGLLAGVAMGVDFPSSSRRFARLAAP